MTIAANMISFIHCESSLAFNRYFAYINVVFDGIFCRNLKFRYEDGFLSTLSALYQTGSVIKRLKALFHYRQRRLWVPLR